jgi:hypothetical protein
MLLAASLLLSAAESHSSPGATPWLVGGAVLLVLVAMVAGLMAFGGGRDHS